MTEGHEAFTPSGELVPEAAQFADPLIESLAAHGPVRCALQGSQGRTDFLYQPRIESGVERIGQLVAQDLEAFRQQLRHTQHVLEG